MILKDCRDQMAKLGALELAAIAGAYLAKAYAAMGRLDDALEAADRAGTDLPPTSDPPVEALVRHTAVQIVADSGDIGAAAGLQYARAITRGWWAERLRGLYAVRSALASHELSIRHDAEWRAAREDPLTGVGNRRALDERMSAALDSGRSIAVIAIDVDNLKVVNDSHGHACGDEVLRRVAQLLTEQCRADDVVARAGGDEFVVVLDNPDERGARELVERIKAAADRVAQGAVEPWFAMLRLSIGQASSTDGTPSPNCSPRPTAGCTPRSASAGLEVQKTFSDQGPDLREIVGDDIVAVAQQVGQGVEDLADAQVSVTGSDEPGQYGVGLLGSAHPALAAQHDRRGILCAWLPAVSWTTSSAVVR